MNATLGLRPAGRRGGFTLVELLVVIAIIAVLVALLLPAVNGAREMGRRVTCTSNLSNLALATSRANDTNGSLPGWRTPIRSGSTSTARSWPVVLLPFMERVDVYRTYTSGAGAGAAPYIATFVCPSSPPDTLTSPTMAYSANAGSGGNDVNGTGASGRKADGVMTDNTLGAANRYSLDDISSADGTANTVLYSEECNSSLVPTQALWNGGNNWLTLGFGVSGNRPATRIINAPAVSAFLPSSNHPGGVVAAFCDGRTEFLKEGLAFHVYAQLVSSNHVGASPFIQSTTATGWSLVGYVLSDGDYK